MSGVAARGSRGSRRLSDLLDAYVSGVYSRNDVLARLAVKGEDYMPLDDDIVRIVVQWQLGRLSGKTAIEMILEHEWMLVRT